MPIGDRHGALEPRASKRTKWVPTDRQERLDDKLAPRRGNTLRAVRSRCGVCALAVSVAAVLATSASAARAAAPLIGQGRPGALPHKYIVVMKRTATAAVRAQAMRRAGAHGGTVTHAYSAGLKGYSATLPAAALKAARQDPNVAYVEADGIARISAMQLGATWGLDRVDQASLPMDFTYVHAQTGAGVKAYVIDTGIRLSHREFGGRARTGIDEVDGGPADDCQGHGTHVAGTLGGRTYGVAKSVTLVAVRVFDCAGDGQVSGILAGIDWVTADHASGAPAVANASFGGPAWRALDDAVQRSIDDGVTYAVAAGNDNTDACGASPARSQARSRSAPRRAATHAHRSRTSGRASISSHPVTRSCRRGAHPIPRSPCCQGPRWRRRTSLARLPCTCRATRRPPLRPWRTR